MKLLKATILLVCFQEAFASDSQAPLNKLKQDVNDQHRKLKSTKFLKKPCKVIKVEYLRISDFDISGSEASGDGDYVCEVDKSDADGISGTRIKMNLSDVQRATMNNAMEKGSLVSGRSTYFTNDITFTSEGMLNVPKYDSMVPSHFQRSHSEARNLQNDPIHVGNKPILAVRVTANDYDVVDDAGTISDKIFGTDGDDANLASQMFACSGGQLTIISDYENNKLSAPGVLEVSIDMNLDGSSDMAIDNAITTAVQLKLGFNLPGPFEQVMYIKYACFPTSCTYAAYAYINSWMSMFQGDYYKKVGVQMHEIGHNFGLAHSGMGVGGYYKDHTCLMGNPLYSDDDGSMCFNPAKSWQLGWYSPFYEDVYVGAGQEWEGKLIGVSDYNNNPNSDKIVLRIETDTQDDYFVGFNRAIGINSDNDLCDNCVTVIKTGNNGEGYSQSWNQINPQGGLLENGFFLIENHLNSGKTLRIDVVQINLDVSPGFAHVSIKFEDEVDCKNWCNEISIPWNDLVGTTQKCDFTELCDGCPECEDVKEPDDYWLVCGKSDRCDVPSKKASADELHEVRCCSDTSKTGWKKKGSCDVWGESDLPECKHAETYESADQICKDNDARLCTKSELEGDCTAGSGCMHDDDHVWSSTPF